MVGMLSCSKDDNQDDQAGEWDYVYVAPCAYDNQPIIVCCNYVQCEVRVGDKTFTCNKMGDCTDAIEETGKYCKR